MIDETAVDETVVVGKTVDGTTVVGKTVDGTAVDGTTVDGTAVDGTAVDGTASTRLFPPLYRTGCVLQSSMGSPLRNTMHGLSAPSRVHGCVGTIHSVRGDVQTRISEVYAPQGIHCLTEGMSNMRVCFPTESGHLLFVSCKSLCCACDIAQLRGAVGI